MIILDLPALLLIAIPIWLAYRIWSYRHYRLTFDWRRELVAHVLPGAYAIAVAYFVFFPLRLPLGHGWRPFYRSVNILPVIETVRMLYLNPQRGLLNVAGNIVLFLPLGILAPWLYPRLREPGRVLAAGFRLSLLIEVIQFFIGNRSSDIDDVLLNTLGAALGYGVFWLGRWAFAAAFPDRAQQWASPGAGLTPAETDGQISSHNSTEV